MLVNNDVIYFETLRQHQDPAVAGVAPKGWYLGEGYLGESGVNLTSAIPTLEPFGCVWVALVSNKLRKVSRRSEGSERPRSAGQKVCK